MKNSAAKIFCLALIGTTAGCHSVRRGEPFVGPLQLNSKQQTGHIIFQQRCDQCHPHGEAGLGPALNNKPAPVFLMKTQVRLGLGAMPRFDEHLISEQALDDLMSYVIALRKADKEAKAQPVNKNKSANEEKPASVEKPTSQPVRQTK